MKKENKNTRKIWNIKELTEIYISLFINLYPQEITLENLSKTKADKIHWSRELKSTFFLHKLISSIEKEQEKQKSYEIEEKLLSLKTDIESKLDIIERKIKLRQRLIKSFGITIGIIFINTFIDAFEGSLQYIFISSVAFFIAYAFLKGSEEWNEKLEKEIYNKGFYKGYQAGLKDGKERAKSERLSDYNNNNE
jgi:hypothetical protein